MIEVQRMPQIVIIREGEFAEFVQEASEEDLEEQGQCLQAHLNERFRDVRSPIADRMRDRLGVIHHALGYAD